MYLHGVNNNHSVLMFAITKIGDKIYRLTTVYIIYAQWLGYFVNNWLADLRYYDKMMASLNFHIEIKPGMNLEFMQTIGSIIIELWNIEGCIGVDFKQDSNYFTKIISYWITGLYIRFYFFWYSKAPCGLMPGLKLGKRVNSQAG